MTVHYNGSVCLACAVRPETREMTVLGAAIAAGLACGLWRDLAGLPTLNTSVAYPEIGPDGEENPCHY